MSSVLWLTKFMVVALAGLPAAADETAIELRSELLVTGLQLEQFNTPVYGIRLTAQVDENGQGSGTLELNPNVPVYDEFGFQVSAGELPIIKLDCTMKLVKRQTRQMPESARVAAPLVDVNYVLIGIQGPNIKSQLFVATEDKALGQWGRLLIHDEKGNVRHAILLTAPPPPEPCHPGCFPAGTLIQTPGGTEPVENLRVGNIVTTFGADGKRGQGKIEVVFVTTNRLIDVETEWATLITTETQPLAIAEGGLRPAGELKSGDRIFTWDGSERRSVVVRSVESTGREARVFNVVLGEPVLFVAGGFLARSKPPAHPIDAKIP